MFQVIELQGRGNDKGHICCIEINKIVCLQQNEASKHISVFTLNCVWAVIETKEEILQKIADVQQAGVVCLGVAINHDSHGTCLFGKCPILAINPNAGCCAAYDAYEDNFDVPIINEEALKLIKRMDEFDIPAIVENINKAIKENDHA